MNPQFGRSRLPELLAKIGKTQVDLAEYMGVSESYISQVTKGKTRLSSLRMKMAADFCKCHMEDLYEWIYE